MGGVLALYVSFWGANSQLYSLTPLRQIAIFLLFVALVIITDVS